MHERHAVNCCMQSIAHEPGEGMCWLLQDEKGIALKHTTVLLHRHMEQLLETVCTLLLVWQLQQLTHLGCRLHTNSTSLLMKRGNRDCWPVHTTRTAQQGGIHHNQHTACLELWQGVGPMRAQC
jgi:hypothetical protein